MIIGEFLNSGDGSGSGLWMSERLVSDCLILAGISLFMSNIVTGVLGMNEKYQKSRQCAAVYVLTGDVWIS